MKHYTKVEQVYARDPHNGKKLKEGSFNNPVVEYLKDNQWVFTEKVDGTNIGVVWDGYRVSFQGRTDSADIYPKLLDKLNELFMGDENEELFEQKFHDMGVILFGEGYGPNVAAKSKLYGPDYNFILFDVYIPSKDLWMTRESIEDIANYFGISPVPIVMEGTINDAVEYVRTQPKSTLSGNAPMEGLVGKPKVEVLDRQGKRTLIKVKAKYFK